VSAALFRSCLEEALLALHGAVGGAVGLELLRFDDGSGEGLVAVDGRDAHKLWPAAALVTQMRGEQCTLQARIPDRSAVTAPASAAAKRLSTGTERARSAFAAQVLGSAPSLLALANDSRAFCAALVAEEARAAATAQMNAP
jgi:hypothetical protein